MKIINHTGFGGAELFLSQRLKKYDTQRLKIELKYGRSDYTHFSGSYKPPPKYDRVTFHEVVARSNPEKPYPLHHKDFVGTVQLTDEERKKRNYLYGYETIWDQEDIDNPEESLVFSFGQQVWYYLVKTKQESGKWKTKSNCFAFLLLREFKSFMVGLI